MARKPRLEVIKATESMVKLQVSRPEMVRELEKTFNISSRQAHRYVERVLNELAKESEDQKPMRKHYLRQSLIAVFQKAMSSDKLNAAVQALDKLAKIDGFYAPVQLDHTVSGSIDLKKMTSDDKRKRLQELMERAAEVAPLPGRSDDLSN